MQHRLAFALALSLAGVAGSAGSAMAQRMPDMATLDRGDGISRLGLDFGAAFPDDSIEGFDAALRFDFFGQLISRQGLGVYGSLPISILVGEGDNETALGNIEVGGLYVIDSPAVSYVFRAGLALPTADDDGLGFAANVLASWSRLTDLSQAIPNATYLRLGFSPLYHANRVFLRADLGVDLAVQDDDQLEIAGVVFGFDAENLFRINVGGGIDLGSVALMAELVNVASTSSLDDDDDNDFLNTFALSARFMGGSLQPYFTFGVPLDDLGRDVIDFFLGAGLQVAF